MLEKCGLLRLNLAFNRLENEGAGHLATALLHSNSKLRSLDIRSNNIKGDGLCSLADAIKFNSALNELFLWGNVNEERACLVCYLLFFLFRHSYSLKFSRLLKIFLVFIVLKLKMSMLHRIVLMLERISLNRPIHSINIHIGNKSNHVFVFNRLSTENR